MPGVLTPAGLAADAWLAERLGRRVYRLETDGLAALPETEAKRRVDAACAEAAAPSMVWTRVPVAETGVVGVLARAGFGLVDTGVTLERSRFGRCDVLSRCEIRAALPEDRRPVTDLARSAFRWSRFHRDPAIPDHVADEIKAAWADGFFRARRGDAMAVAADGERVVGFLLALAAADGAMVIDLVAVDPAWRGRRIAGDLTRFAQTQLPSATRLRVGTQLANTASLQAYHSLAFAVAGASYVLHRHQA